MNHKSSQRCYRESKCNVKKPDKKMTTNKVLRYAAGCYYKDSSSTRFVSGIDGDLNKDYVVAYFASYADAQAYLDGKDGYFKIITLKTPVINAGNSFMRYYSPSV